MGEGRASGGLLVSALGSTLVAVAIFLPWYAISITPAGAAAAQQQLSNVAQQYGNTNLQALAGQIGSQFGSVAGRPLVTVSAHQSLKYTSAILLLLAGVSLLASLLRLAGTIDVGGGWAVTLGFLAILCVLYRMAVPPGTDTGFISLSLSWGSWLTLVGACAVALGGVWSPPAGTGALRPSYRV